MPPAPIRSTSPPREAAFLPWPEPRGIARAPRVLLISTYELGRQPFGLASPAAWLTEEGARVTCLDLSVERLAEDVVRAADLVAFYLPMHTATRIAARAAARVRELNPRAHLCFYGLYAPLNEAYLRTLGAGTILGGEFESGLVSLVRRLGAGQTTQRIDDGAMPPYDGGPPPSLDDRRRVAPQPEPLVSLERQRFRVPDRAGLPELDRYARLDRGDGRQRVVGYTEATRGCKHLCRHCPIPPVYGGRFRVVQRDVVLEDVRRQVAAGAEHITFGDPDFFNGVGHARALVRALHSEHPDLTYDVTIKVEHLLAHARELSLLRETGCLFVTTAVESLDDEVLARLDKGHTRADVVEVVRLCREEELLLHPTFVPFTPWISLDGYLELLDAIEELDLVENVAQVQLAIRLLVPAASKLLELEEIRSLVGRFDPIALVHPWRHPDARVDRLQARVEGLVRESSAAGEPRSVTFRRVRRAAAEAAGRPADDVHAPGPAPARVTIPYLTEPWYC